MNAPADADFVFILIRPSLAAKPKAALALRYAKVEMVPPHPGEFGEIARGLGRIVRGAKTGHWRTLTMREAFLNTCITFEVLCWFFVGECIGKRSLIGYQV